MIHILGGVCTVRFQRTTKQTRHTPPLLLWHNMDEGPAAFVFDDFFHHNSDLGSAVTEDPLAQLDLLHLLGEGRLGFTPVAPV